MSEIITLKGIQELVRKKINGDSIPEEQIKKVENYIALKKDMLNKPNSPFYKTRSLDEAYVKQTTWYLNNIFNSKDASRFRLPREVHPAGHVQHGFVIEPIGRGVYLYNWLGMRGKVHSNIIEGMKTSFIEIGYERIEIIGKPIKKFCYNNMPKDDNVNKWLDYDLENPTIMEIWDDLIKHFKVFGDLGMDIYYYTLALFVIQSWVYELLPSVFYVSIQGQFGGGKTILAEMTIELCKHGKFARPSEPYIARMSDGQKITLFVDEIDSLYGTEDSSVLSIIRTGYRKGATHDILVKKDDNWEPEAFNTYGPKIFTAHGQVEEALMSRSLPVLTTESDVSQLAIINSFRYKYTSFIYDKLFFYYINNIIMVDLVDQVDYSGDGQGGYSREEIYQSASLYAGIGQLRELGQLKGRNTELGFVVAKIIKLIKSESPLSCPNEVNQDSKEGQNGLIFDNLITEIFENKKEIDEENSDIGTKGLMRDYLCKMLDKKRGMDEFITQEGFIKIANKEIVDGFQRFCKDKQQIMVHSSQVKGLMREFGFERPDTIKKMKVRLPDETEQKSRLALIFDLKVLRKLGLKAEKIEVGLNKIMEESVVK